tara:strand:+ start:492 stop:1043 length:552 start_codon:yes stop_codon:yes gene_type:complete
VFISSINEIEIGATVTRHNVMSGSVFKYVEGNGTLYASFGMCDVNNAQTYIGGKMRGDAVASITATPVDSPNVRRNVTIEGTFSIVANMYEVPNIQVFTENDGLSFGKIVSLKDHVDSAGNSHLYMTMGNDVGRHTLGHHLLLKLTRDNPVLPDGRCHYVGLPSKSLLALRGDAGIVFECREQ